MKVTGREQADWGFELPIKGHYVLEFTDDIRRLSSDESEKEPLILNTQIVGSDYDEVKVAIFIPWDNDFGRQKICDILVCTGLAPYFEKKFSDETDVFDKVVLKELKVKLPGKRIDAKISIKKLPDKDRDVANIDRIEKVGKGSTMASTKTSKKELDEDDAGF